MIKIGIVKGLASINKKVADEEAKFSGGGKSTKWFKLADKQSVKVVFLQELDPDSPNFSKKNDVGILAVEHQNPDNFRNKALCTADEGGCWACEQHAKDWKAGWKQRQKLYINVLVDNGTDEPYVAVLSQGFGPKSITQTLIEYATEDGTIADKYFKIKRNGAGFSDTSYLLMPGAAHDLNVEDYELFDIENDVLRHVPYDEQEAHYMRDVDGPAATTPPFEVSTGAPPSDEW